MPLRVILILDCILQIVSTQQRCRQIQQMKHHFLYSIIHLELEMGVLLEHTMVVDRLQIMIRTILSVF